MKIALKSSPRNLQKSIKLELSAFAFPDKRNQATSPTPVSKKSCSLKKRKQQVLKSPAGPSKSAQAKKLDYYSLRNLSKEKKQPRVLFPSKLLEKNNLVDRSANLEYVLK